MSGPREGLELTVRAVLTPEQLALFFCEFSDDEQAAFFIAIGRHAAFWTAPGASMQWWRVGRHLRDHAQSTYEGRRVVLEMAEGLNP